MTDDQLQTLMKSETERIRSLTLANIENIPDALKQVAHWHVFKLKPRETTGEKVKWGKPPIDPETGRERGEWQKHGMTFTAALSALKRNKAGNLAGMGLVMSEKTGGLVGIDLDSAIQIDGTLEPWAVKIVDAFPGYCERSPSLCGFRLLGYGDIPERGRKVGDIEAYKDGRFLTITGNVWQGRNQVTDFPKEALSWFWSTFIDVPKKPAATAPTPKTTGERERAHIPGYPRTPEEVISLIERSASAAKFRALADGENPNLPGDSEGDLSLCSVLAFYCGNDPALIEATFGRTKRAERDKWSGRADYRNRTIQKAISQTTETYQPKSGGEYYRPELDKNGKVTNPESFPEPVRLEEAELPKIPSGAFPLWVENMIDAVTAATEAPRDLVAGTALAALATALQKKFSIMPEGGYFEQLSFYVLLILESSGRKSAVTGYLVNPIRECERQLMKAAEEKIKRINQGNKLTEGRIKKLTDDYAKAKAADLERIRKEIESLQESLEPVPVLPTLTVSDITTEQLAVVMAENGEKVGLFADEGGIFETMAGRYSHGVGNIDLYLQGYTGKEPVKVNRGSRPPVLIEHPALTMCISGQPEVLAGLGSKPGFKGRGLLGRFTYLVPPSNIGYRTLQTTPVPEMVQATYNRNLRALLDMAPAQNENGEYPHTIKLSGKAWRAWKEFAHAVEDGMKRGGGLEQIKDFCGKLPGQAARIAGVLHCAEYAEGNPHTWEVSEETMENALSMAGVILEHAKFAYGLIGTDAKMEDAKRAWNWIEGNQANTFTGRDCFNALKGHFKDMANLTTALEVLTEREYIFEIPAEHKRGRPSRRFLVNPKATRGEA